MSTKSERIPLSVPVFGGNEARYLQECVETGWVSSVGPFVDRFENAVAEYVGVKHAVAMVNGTAALHLALLLSGVKPGEGVLVPSLTFIAPVNAIRYVGAVPFFAEVDEKFAQLDVNALDRFLRQKTECRPDGCYHRESGVRIRAILPVDLLGHSVDLDPIMKLAQEFDLELVEDATESLGADYRGKKVGSQAPISCLSFNGNKTITCGGGGMLLTDQDFVASRARYLSTQAKDHPVEYIHHEVGYNYRLTNLQAAVGCAQMEVVEKFVSRRRAIASRYRSAFENHASVKIMDEPPWGKSSCWLSTIRIRRASGKAPEQVMSLLESAGIQARKLWQPNHQSPAHVAVGIRCGDLQEAEGWYQEGLSLPSSPNLSSDEQERVIQGVLEALS